MQVETDKDKFVEIDEHHNWEHLHISNEDSC